MAIDPPYRLDPFRNIINVHWGEEAQSTSTGGGGGGPQRLITVVLMGSHWSSGYHNINIYDIYFGYENPGIGFTVSGIPAYVNIANYNLTNPENWATAWVSSAASGLYFAGTWESHQNGTNATLESWGPYGMDLSGATGWYNYDPTTIFRAVALTDVVPLYWGGDNSYSGWLGGTLVLEADA